MRSAPSNLPVAVALRTVKARVPFVKVTSMGLPTANPRTVSPFTVMDKRPAVTLNPSVSVIIHSPATDCATADVAERAKTSDARTALCILTPPHERRRFYRWRAV